MAERKYYRTGGKKRLAKKILRVLTIGLGGLILLGVFMFIYFAKDLPDPSRIDERIITQSTKIYDRTGETILFDIHGEEKRTVIPFSKIPQNIKNASIAIEDQNFYSHPGVDIRAIVTAFINYVRGSRLRGASTITQQFIKNSILTSERTFTRKIKEAILAVELERKYDKDEILNFYLNQIPYGSNAYGVEAAAQTFFSKHAEDLTLAESALLASLPNAPSFFSPYGSNAEDLLNRKNITLDRMRKMGFISREEEEDARNEVLEFSQNKTSINAPHFVFYIREILEEKYGEDYLSQAGLKVITTIDWELQQLAERVVKEGAERNETQGSFNASLVAINPKNGQILSMVGSRDYFQDPLPEGCTPGVDCKFEPQVNVTLRNRQPGSAFKPFVYATAFEKGYTDKTILFDVATEFNVNCDAFGNPERSEVDCYSPRNYDGIFKGPVTIRQALANSINIPSVKLLYLVGSDDAINTAQDMGITTLKDRSRFGLSLVLGGGEVKLLDITSAFGVFAQEGIRHPATGILRIEDSKGNILEEFISEPSQVIGAEATRILSNILSDNVARIPVFGANSPLAFSDRQVAAKTGTTNEFRDGWTIGYTPSISVGVWTGNNDNSVTRKTPGVMVSAPIWRAFLNEAFDILNLPPESFTSPKPIANDKPILNGQYVINGEIHNILQYIRKDNPSAGPPSNQDDQFTNWETAVQNWLSGTTGDQSIKTSIFIPGENSKVSRTGFAVGAKAEPTGQVDSVEFFFDEKLMGSLDGTGPEYVFPYNLSVDTESGEHTILIRAHNKTKTAFSESSVRVFLD